MNKKENNDFLFFMIIAYLVSLTFGVIASCAKTCHLFYHQVIVKDEIAGQVNKK